jgi:putative membrane protein
MQEIKNKGAVNDHLANERTYLAWIRTSLGIMVFGFVVVKFTLFMKQIPLLLGKEDVIQTKGYSALLGIVIVLVGTITAILSYIRYKCTEKQLREGQYEHSSLLITILTGFILLVSVFLIAYLIQSTYR